MQLVEKTGEPPARHRVATLIKVRGCVCIRSACVRAWLRECIADMSVGIVWHKSITRSLARVSVRVRGVEVQRCWASCISSMPCDATHTSREVGAHIKRCWFGINWLMLTSFDLLIDIFWFKLQFVLMLWWCTSMMQGTSFDDLSAVFYLTSLDVYLTSFDLKLTSIGIFWCLKHHHFDVCLSRSAWHQLYYIDESICLASK